MYHRRFALATGAVALSSFALLGAGAAAASAAGVPHIQGLGGAHVVSVNTPTVHTETAVVGTKSETILATASGLPLYYFRADTTNKSKVAGELARLWPPLISAKPTASGVKGKVLSVKQAAGTEVSYKGHILYTFIDDSPGHVTGQGVSNFFVATPNVRVNGGTTAAAPPVTSVSHGYGY
jgi:predicted lipoprotein with Yx(FWY)xxD motif